MPSASIILVALLSILLTGCSPGEIFIKQDTKDYPQNFDTLSVITDGVVFQNAKPIFLDVNLSDAYGDRFSETFYELLSKRGFKVRRPLQSIVGTYHLNIDSSFIVLPSGENNFIIKKPPYYYDSQTLQDTIFQISQIRICQYLNSTAIGSKTKIPDTLFDDLINIKSRVKSRYTFFCYFFGINSIPVSKDEQLAWRLASGLASVPLISLASNGALRGYVMAWPCRYSQLKLSVYIINLDTKEVLMYYGNSLTKELCFYELLLNTMYNNLQWKLPCMYGKCKKPSRFYNPLKNN